jgi:hypothetical protein
MWILQRSPGTASPGHVNQDRREEKATTLLRGQSSSRRRSRVPTTALLLPIRRIQSHITNYYLHTQTAARNLEIYLTRPEALDRRSAYLPSSEINLPLSMVYNLSLPPFFASPFFSSTSILSPQFSPISLGNYDCRSGGAGVWKVPDFLPRLQSSNWDFSLQPPLFKLGVSG